MPPAVQVREMNIGVDRSHPLMSNNDRASTSNTSDDRYSAPLMSIFMLNMVLGTGPMTLPYAFDTAGILLSACFLFVLMVLSFMTTTFIVESMALANGLKHRKTQDELQGAAEEQHANEENDGIIERLEIGAIAQYSMPQYLTIFVYLILITYTYGVLMVYCIAFSVSVSEQIGSVHGQDSYPIVLACFACFVAPLCLLNFKKTWPLQLTVGAVRVTVVFFMIIIMARFLADEKNVTSRKWRDMPLWDLGGMPDLFGNAAFTFMVHHSIPGLVFPLRQRRSAHLATAAAYGGSYTIYVVLCVLALWAFGDEQMPKCQNKAGRPCEIQELFNTNFSSADWQWAGRSIVLYPVLIVSVYPLVAITLRNNLRALVGSVCGFRSLSADGPNANSSWVNIMFTACVVVPTVAVGFLTRDVQRVMKYFGGYAGLSLMFFVPSLMIWHARPRAQTARIENLLKSRFGARPGVLAILFFWVACIVFTTCTLLKA